MVGMPEKVIENIRAMNTVVVTTASDAGVPDADSVASIVGAPIRDTSCFDRY